MTPEQKQGLIQSGAAKVSLSLILLLLSLPLVALGVAPIVVQAMNVISLALFVWGCFDVAEAKGYPKLMGLLGLAYCVGLIVLLIIPDKNKVEPS